MRLKVDYTAVDARRVLLGLIGFELLLTLLYVVLSLLGLSMSLATLLRIFDMNHDLSIPSWLSSVQLLAIGVTLLLVAVERRGEPDLPDSLLRMSGLAFLFLAADEGAAIHEEVTVVARRLQLDWLLLSGDHGAWIVIYLTVGLVFGLVFLRAFLVMWRNHRRPTLIAGAGMALLLAGGVLVEALSYVLLPSPQFTVFSMLQVAVEEFLEMSGASLILYSVLLLAPTAPRPAPVDQTGRRNDNTAHDVDLRRMERALKQPEAASASSEADAVTCHARRTIQVPRRAPALRRTPVTS